MPVNFYASTDPEAPTLAGQADSLNNLLKSCLVDGYGAKVPAGWTSPYYDSTFRQRVFLTAGIPRAYIAVRDGGAGTAVAREARLFGYETMSAWNQGAGLFPSVAQRANGYFARKSATLDATARNWFLVADGRRFYLFMESGDVPGTVSMVMFGAFRSYKPNDDYAFQIMGRLVEGATTYTTTQELCNARYPSIATTGNITLMRSYDGVGSGAWGGQITDSSKAAATATAFAGASGMTYPNPVDGGLYLAKTWINETNALRGELPGIWNPLHNRPINHGDTFTGVEGLESREFICLWTSTGGCLFVEISDTWDV